MLAPDIAESVRRYMKRLEEQGYPISFAVVYGSQANGTQDEWSDIDLLVVSPRFDEEIARSDVSLLWITAARVDSRIEPIPCGERQWEEDTTRAIIEIARRHGERVLPAA